MLESTPTSPEISPATPQIPTPVTLSRRKFLFAAGGLACIGCNPNTEAQSKDNHNQKPKANTLEVKSAADLARSAQILEAYEATHMRHPDFVATKAARKNLSLPSQPPHKITREDGIDQDRSMTITFSDLNNKNLVSVIMPILKQDKKDLSKNECITGRTFIIKGKTAPEDKTYKIETAHPVKLDTGVANQFVLTGIDDRGAQKRYKILAVKRAPYKKSAHAYSTKSVIYTPPTSDFMTPTNIKAGKEYVKYVTTVAEQILRSILSDSTLTETSGELKPIIENFRKGLPFIRKMVSKLMVVEHMDPNVYNMIKKGDPRYAKINLIDQVYTEYSINGSEAFSFLDNVHGAMGPLQIKEDTYGYLMANAPIKYGIDLGVLSKDSSAGRKDHVRAVVFAMLLCYDNFLKLKYSLDRHPGLRKMLGDTVGPNYETLMVSNYNASTTMVHKGIEAVITSVKGKRVISIQDFNTLYTKEIGQRGHHLPGGDQVGENANYIAEYFGVPEI